MQKYICLLIFVFGVISVQGAELQYQFNIDTKTVNFSGKEVVALAINDQMPGPTIEATVGDILEVTFNNKMDSETSIHWHGVLLPNDQDGVPYLTTQPIAPHSSFTYRYKITHSGTYWYHSHTGLQEQRGVYGSLVFHPENGERSKTDHDYVLVLSDWIDENPKQVLANLKKDGDYYALKKGSIQSWDRVFANGLEAIKYRLQNAWTRMGPMDLSDVGYDAFLANGKQESYLKASSGETVRVRLINAAASSFFNVEFAGAPMTIVSSDGVDIEPIQAKRLRIAIAETYDIIIPISDNKFYELRATAEDGTGYSSLFIGQGDKVLAPNIPMPNLFLVDHTMHSSHEGMKETMKSMSKATVSSSEKLRKKHTHSMHGMHQPKHNNAQSSVIDYMNNYTLLRSVSSTKLNPKLPLREYTLRLTGDMDAYKWSFNNQTIKEDSQIWVKKGEKVRLNLVNETMMSHPIHLHGHFFRVLNGQGDRSPLKHTVSVGPEETITIEFEANTEKDWFFHCHNLYHMKTGMARVVSYEGSSTFSPEILSHITEDPWYFKGDVSALSNLTMGSFGMSNTRNAFEMEYIYNYKKQYDCDLVYMRLITRFFSFYTGGHVERDSKFDRPHTLPIFGFRYILPMFIEVDARVDANGHTKYELGSELQLTERMNFEWSWGRDKDERYLFCSYEIKKNLFITSMYNVRYHWGIGARAKF